MITKEKILKYFKEQHFDVTLKELFIELNLSVEDLPALEFYLAELVNSGIIRKARPKSKDYFEYDLNYEGVKK